MKQQLERIENAAIDFIASRVDGNSRGEILRHGAIRRGGYKCQENQRVNTRKTGKK